ncbi:hypothetical protein K492DRAFT_174707 [Lichtheimia hyalospora FSU 10163]|nr:hypothetical protein K492DRAFT_174707 [Lichtheimia hyalospora FSU 10163]
MDEGIVSRRTRGLREAITLFHLLVMIVGLGILSLGAYTFNSPFSRTLSLAMLGIGCFITIVSFIAYFGAHIEHAGFLKTYSSTIALVLVLEIILVGLVYAHRREADDYGSKAWDFFSAHDSRLLLDMEQSLHCCGYAGPTDRPVMKCPSLHHGQQLSGCKDAVVNAVYQWREGILAIMLVLLAVKLTALLTAVVLTVMVERDAEEEQEYMAVLSAQNNNHSWYDNSGGPSNIATSAGGSSSPVFGRQLPPYSSSSNRTGFFYAPRPPSYQHQQHNPSRVPRYGSTLSTSSHK